MDDAAAKARRSWVLCLGWPCLLAGVRVGGAGCWVCRWWRENDEREIVPWLGGCCYTVHGTATGLRVRCENM